MTQEDQAVLNESEEYLDRILSERAHKDRQPMGEFHLISLVKLAIDGKLSRDQQVVIMAGLGIAVDEGRAVKVRVHRILDEIPPALSAAILLKLLAEQAKENSGPQPGQDPL